MIFISENRDYLLSDEEDSVKDIGAAEQLKRAIKTSKNERHALYQSNLVRRNRRFYGIVCIPVFLVFIICSLVGESLVLFGFFASLNYLNWIMLPSSSNVPGLQESIDTVKNLKRLRTLVLISKHRKQSLDEVRELLDKLQGKG